MAWIHLLVAGLVEVGWAATMKQTDGFTKPWPTALTIGLMFVGIQLLALVLKEQPMSTAYAVWVGIGAVGAAIIGMTILGERASLMKILFLG